MTISFLSNPHVTTVATYDKEVSLKTVEGVVLVGGSKLKGFYTDQDTTNCRVIKKQDSHDNVLSVTCEKAIVAVKGLDFLSDCVCMVCEKLPNNNIDFETTQGPEKSHAKRTITSVVVKDTETDAINLLVLKQTDKGVFSLFCLSKK